MNFTLFDLPKNETTQCVICEVFRLADRQTDYGESANRIVLKQYLKLCTNENDILNSFNDSFESFMPLKWYKKEQFDGPQQRSLRLEDNWEQKYGLNEIVFRHYYLALAPGCEHFAAGCKYYCPKCEKYYNCKQCHDNNVADHIFCEQNIVQIQCRYCQHEQQLSFSCESCGVKFGHSYCDRCKKFDYRDENSFLPQHCDKCGVCYNTILYQYEHCDKCQRCYEKLMFSRHICNRVCAVCYQDYSLTSDSIYIPKCGHGIHYTCRAQLLSQNIYSCPLCRRVLYENKELEQMQSVINKQYIVICIQKWKIRLLCLCKCYDCERRFVCRRIGIFKCPFCHFFNCHMEQDDVRGAITDRFTDLAQQFFEVILGKPNHCLLAYGYCSSDDAFIAFLQQYQPIELLDMEFDLFNQQYIRFLAR